MKQAHSFRLIVGWLTILSVFFAFANFTLTGMAGGSNAQEFSDLYYFIEAGVEAGVLMKWSWLADMVGYYLLLIPATFLIHYWLKSKTPYWMSMYTFCGLAYILTGSIGAAILAKTWPTLISGYTGADEPIKEMYRIVFTNSTEMVYGGLWGYLEFLLAGVWWIGIGFTMRSERKALGIVTIILGIVTLATFAGDVFGLKLVAFVGLTIYLVLAPLWALFLGISLVRGREMRIALP